MSDQTGSWQPDPFGRHQYRYWNGTEWTDQVSNDGNISVDPPTGEPVPTEATPSVPTEPEPTQVGGWGAAPPPDPTTAMPAAGGPGAPVAPGPGTPSKSGGNKPLLIGGAIVVLAILGLGAYFLLGRDDASASRDDLIADMRDEGLTKQQANCIVDELEKTMSIKRITELTKNDNAEPTSAEDRALEAATAKCLFGAADDDEETTDTTVEDDDEETTSSTTPDVDPGDLGELGALGDLFGNMTDAQAECLTTEFEKFEEQYDLEGLEDDPEALFANMGLLSEIMGVFATCDVELDALLGGMLGGEGMEGMFDLQSGDSYGDNPTLDALWDKCEAGDMGACDDLYMESGFGTEYEEFGDTCGGRQSSGAWCDD